MATFEDIIKRINRRIGQLVAKEEREIARKYARTLVEMRAVLAKQYEQYEQNGKLTMEEMLKYNRTKKMMGELDFLLKKHHKDVKKSMGQIIKDVYQEGFLRTAHAVETFTKTKLGYSAVRPETLEAMLNNPVNGLTLNQRLERQRADIIYQIQQQVTQGLQNNETYSTMSKRLKNELEGDAVKATRIVRTEGHRAQETGKLDAMDHANKNGVITMKQWNTLEDERVRKKPKSIADHKQLNNKKIKMDELFFDGLSKGLAPSQLPAAASSINCRCFLTYSVERVERVQHEELEGMAFEQWEKERLNKQGQPAGASKPKETAKRAAQPAAAAKVNAAEKPREAAKPKEAAKPAVITAKAQERFKEVTDLKEPMEEKGLRKYTKALLEKSGLGHLNLSIKKLKGAYGMVRYYNRQRENETYADTVDFFLDSGDARPERYKLKTLFHEFYHANYHNLAIEREHKNRTMWEETATELAAHWMIKEKGVEGMVIPSYGQYLTINLPRLKKLDEFKDAESLEDFGGIFMKYRFDEDHKTGKWKWLEKQVDEANKGFDYFGYTDKHYDRYLFENREQCVVDLCESIGEGYSKQQRYKEWINKQIDEGVLHRKNTTGYDMAILWAMKKLGVK